MLNEDKVLTLCVNKIADGQVVMVPIALPDYVERIKEMCYSKVGPLYVRIDMTSETYVICKDFYNQKGRRW